MKEYVYRLFMVLFTICSIISCSDDEGTNPGNDSAPVITVYQYKPTKPYNAENDIQLRFAFNNKTTEAYYLTEKTTDKDSHVSSMGKDGYMDYVVSKGIKLGDLSESLSADVMLTDLYGEYTITTVAVGKSARTSIETVFIGLDWADVATGTYKFCKPKVTGVASSPTTLQVCKTNSELYRFKDVYGKGYHLKINLIKYKGSDTHGEYQFFRIPATETPITYGTYGTVNVRDIGYWKGSDDYVTKNGYESGMYSDYNCFLYIQYYVTAGSLGSGYDEFTVN